MIVFVVENRSMIWNTFPSNDILEPMVQSFAHNLVLMYSIFSISLLRVFLYWNRHITFPDDICDGWQVILKVCGACRNLFVHNTLAYSQFIPNFTLVCLVIIKLNLHFVDDILIFRNISAGRACPQSFSNNDTAANVPSLRQVRHILCTITWSVSLLTRQKKMHSILNYSFINYCRFIDRIAMPTCNNLASLKWSTRKVQDFKTSFSPPHICTMH